MIYLEACFSGSMFEKHLPLNHNIFAVTAANTEESSYSAYYDPIRKVCTVFPRILEHATLSVLRKYIFLEIFLEIIELIILITIDCLFDHLYG